MANAAKKNQVEQLSSLLKNSSHFALVKFSNTPHSALEQLRKELKKNEANFKVVKKSLFQKAINKLALVDKNLKQLQTKVFPLKENSALLTLGQDYAKGLSAFAKFAKNEQSLSFKFGFLDKKVYLADEVQKISLLPGKDQLMGQLVASLKSPQTKFVHALQFNSGKLVYLLKGESKQN